MHDDIREAAESETEYGRENDPCCLQASLPLLERVRLSQPAGHAFISTHFVTSRVGEPNPTTRSMRES